MKRILRKKGIIFYCKRYRVGRVVCSENAGLSLRFDYAKAGDGRQYCKSYNFFSDMNNFIKICWLCFCFLTGSAGTACAEGSSTILNRLAVAEISSRADSVKLQIPDSLLVNATNTSKVSLVRYGAVTGPIITVLALLFFWHIRKNRDADKLETAKENSLLDDESRWEEQKKRV
jgi:nitrogen fixation-related uncharacterized protein